MAFLSPWFLLGLLAVGIPLAIHLIRREKAVKMVFSTIRFLKKAPKKMIFFQQIQQWLLLLLRAAIICLLAFAFARPFMQGTLSQLTGFAPQSVVILIDYSMSMQYGDYFNRAQSAAQKIIQTLTGGDEAAVIAFTDGTGQVKDLTTDIPELESFIRNLATPGYEPTRYLPALRLADQLLQNARYEDRTVYLISDYQRRAFEGFDASWQLAPGVSFESINIADEESENLAVTDVNSPAQLFRDQEEHRILARVRNLGTRHLSEARVTLKINDRTIATRTVDLTDKSEVVVEFTTTFAQRGLYQGVVEVADATYPPDNHHYFTVNVLPPVKILCVNGETARDRFGDESYWFRLAMGKRNESPFQVDVIRPQQMQTATLDDYQVVVLLNVNRLDRTRSAALTKFVRAGGSVLLAPGDQVEARAFNSQFAEISPATLDRPVSDMGDDFRVLADINFRHPVLQPLWSSGSSDFGAAQFQGYWEVHPTDDAVIIMRFDNGAPAYLERRVENGRTILFTSSLDTEWSNLPLQVFFLPLMHETVRYLALREEKKRSYTVGESVPVPIPTGTVARVQAPGGDEQEVRQTPGGRPYYTDTATPGFYHVQATGFEDRFAVNIDPEESDLSPITPAEIRDVILNSDPRPRASLEVRASMLHTQLEKSQHFWWWLLLSVLLLGIVETLLANRTYR